MAVCSIKWLIQSINISLPCHRYGQSYLPEYVVWTPYNVSRFHGKKEHIMFIYINTKDIGKPVRGQYVKGYSIMTHHHQNAVDRKIDNFNTFKYLPIKHARRSVHRWRAHRYNVRRRAHLRRVHKYNLNRIKNLIRHHVNSKKVYQLTSKIEKSNRFSKLDQSLIKLIEHTAYYQGYNKMNNRAYHQGYRDGYINANDKGGLAFTNKYRRNNQYKKGFIYAVRYTNKSSMASHNGPISNKTALKLFNSYANHHIKSFRSARNKDIRLDGFFELDNGSLLI